MDCPNVDVPCAATDSIAVLSPDPVEVEELRAQTQAAADKYSEQFRKRPPATIIVPGGTISSELHVKLEANGYDVLMPWITAKQRKTLREDMIRSQVDAQLVGQPDAIKAAAIASALDQLRNVPTQSPSRSVLAHELGHKWFITQFAKSGDDTIQHAYGGWAPDWLDEAVAVSMENAALQSRRRSAFNKASPEDRIALTDFLTMEHPSANVARALAERLRIADEGETNPLKTLETAPDEANVKTVRRTSRVITLSGKEGQQFVADSGGDRVLMFYSQALIFGEYLVDRTGNPSILMEIATALLDDQSFETWLATNPYKLPQTLAELQDDWNAFIASEPL